MTETARPEDLLTRVGLFAALGRRRARQAGWRTWIPSSLTAGGEVFRQGDSGDSLYVVAAGRWASSWRRPTAGARFGWARSRRAISSARWRCSPASRARPRSAPTARSTILQLPRERFLALVVREPTISLTIAATLSQRLRSANEARVEHAALVATAIEAALRQLLRRAARRRARGEPARHTAAAAPLQARFGAEADAVAADLQNLGVGGSDLGTALRVLRERFERELGRERARRARRGARGPARGRRSLARRARRAGPRVDPGRLRRDAGARPARGPRARRRARAALDRARRGRARDHRRRSGPGARRASRSARRSRPGAGRPAPRLGGALVAGDQAAGPRLSTEIARLVDRPDDRLIDRVRVPPHRRRHGGGLSRRQRGCRGSLRRDRRLARRQPLWALRVAAARRHRADDESRSCPEFAVGLMLVAGWVLLGVAPTPVSPRGLRVQGVARSSSRTYGLARGHRTIRTRSSASACCLVRRLPSGCAVADGDAAGDAGCSSRRSCRPAPGRVSLTSPLALAVAEALRLPERGRSLGLAGPRGVGGRGPLMFAFLNGSGTCLLAWGLLPGSQPRALQLGRLVRGRRTADHPGGARLARCCCARCSRPSPWPSSRCSASVSRWRCSAPSRRRETRHDRHSRADGRGLGGRAVARPRAGDDRAARVAGHRGARDLRPAGAAIARDWSFRSSSVWS